MKNIKTLFSKFWLRSSIAFWKKGGDSVIGELQDHGVDYQAMRVFYSAYGSVQLELVEKMITERLRDYEEAEKMGRNELAYLGLDMLQALQSQIEIESSYEEKTRSMQKELAEIEKNRI